jgi:hypothetical protein
MRLLRECVRTVTQRLGGADDSQGSEALLRSLADAFVQNTPYPTKMSGQEFAAALRAEAAAADQAFPRPKARYVVKLKRGQELAAKDVGGASDPFAYVGVVPAHVAVCASRAAAR